jgi:CheY-like chemotaxis protein/anti-sigma regulatory factor (Ser/Thr protein kinase)
MGALHLIAGRAHDADRVRRMAQLAMDAVERGVSITSRLLTLGRRRDLRAEPLDLQSLLQGLHEILSHTLGVAVRVTLRLGPSLPPVLADRGQLETVLVNLATNARDAMPDGGEIIVSAELEIVSPNVAGSPAGLAPGRYGRVAVADQGIGMDAATLARSQEPFFTTKEPGKGTGLGLALAHSFAEQSGGRLTIESVRGVGTTVVLWLPEAPVSADEMPAPIRTASRTTDRCARILLVDDEALIRIVLARHLEDAGYDVLVASSGEEALALAAEVEVDGLITDLAMPGMDGITLIQRLQADNPGLPALLLTGYASAETELAVIGAIPGTFFLLRKPVSDVQLLDRLRTLLAARG